MSIIDYDNSLEIINSIVDSTNNLIPMLKLNLELNNTIYSTVERIFIFMNKALSVLPDFLIADKHLEAMKTKIIQQFDLVFEGWRDFKNKPEVFFGAWESYFNHWNDFYKTLKEIKKKNSLVFISMN